MTHDIEKNIQDGWKGFTNTSKEYMQELMNTPFPWDEFKKLAQNGEIVQRNKQLKPDGGEYYELVMSDQHEHLAQHLMMTLFKESIGGVPVHIQVEAEGNAIVLKTDFIGPKPSK